MTERFKLQSVRKRLLGLGLTVGMIAGACSSPSPDGQVDGWKVIDCEGTRELSFTTEKAAGEFLELSALRDPRGNIGPGVILYSTGAGSFFILNRLGGRITTTDIGGIEAGGSGRDIMVADKILSFTNEEVNYRVTSLVGVAGGTEFSVTIHCL